MTFKNKIAVITGGSTGIGLATAQLFAKEGAKVVITGRNQTALDEALATLDGRATAVVGDVAQLADLDRLFQVVKETYGRVDHLVVNAGVAKTGYIWEVDEAFFDWHFDINVKGAYFTIQKALPLFPETGGSIVMVSSCVHLLGRSNWSVYTATKAALRSLTRTLAADLYPKKIRVNSISPGAVATPMIGKLGYDDEDMMNYSKVIPLKRYGTPEEMGESILFLSSEKGAYITGTDLLVDGGLAEIGEIEP